MDDPGKRLMDSVRTNGEEIEWNGHMKHGDDTLLLFTKKDEAVMTFIETDEEGIEELISNLRLAKEGLE